MRNKEIRKEDSLWISPFFSNSEGNFCMVSWYNTERLHGAIGHRPPQEMEDEFYAELNTLEKAA